jgi:hypothetical protein
VNLVFFDRENVSCAIRTRSFFQEVFFRHRGRRLSGAFHFQHNVFYQSSTHSLERENRGLSVRRWSFPDCDGRRDSIRDRRTIFISIRRLGKSIEFWISRRLRSLNYQHPMVQAQIAEFARRGSTNLPQAGVMISLVWSSRNSLPQRMIWSQLIDSKD